MWEIPIQCLKNFGRSLTVFFSFGTPLIHLSIKNIKKISTNEFANPKTSEFSLLKMNITALLQSSRFNPVHLRLRIIFSWLIWFGLLLSSS